jgi:hypothetical protein
VKKNLQASEGAEARRQVHPHRDRLKGIISPVSQTLQGCTCRRICPTSKPPNHKHFRIYCLLLANSSRAFEYSMYMGLRFEIREKIACQDVFCLARAVLETTAGNIGIKVNTEIEKKIEEELGKLLENKRHFDGIFTFRLHDLKIDIYDVKFDIMYCNLEEGCVGYLTTIIEIEATHNTDSLKQVVKKLLRNIGADKYVRICE